MKHEKLINFYKKIKPLGLLGLLGWVGIALSIPFLKPFNFIWLLYLLDFIVYKDLLLLMLNPFVLFQSLKQIVGNVLAPLRYGFRLPSASNYTGKVNFTLPFEGEWIAVNGGITKETSHSWSIVSQRYAYDFYKTVEQGNSFSGEQGNLSNYYCYGKNVLSPADGVVVRISDGKKDSRIIGNGKPDPLINDIRGNFIIIKHANQTYSAIAHLKKGSFLVSVNQRVKQGQVVAQCGNSGASTEPHIHFQIQDSKSFFLSAGIPIRFNCAAGNQPNVHSGFIERGERVRNL